MNDKSSLFETLEKSIPLQDVFEAYFACRKHKRGTINALSFELDYEHNLIKLWKEINNGTYKIGRSITFIVTKPVKREIFAADFRDRIVHHLLMKRLMPLFEHIFVDETYSCRKGKGTLYGIQDIFQKIKKASQNYTKECYVMKMDVQAFFMSIDKNILFGKLEDMVNKYYCLGDKDIILHLLKQVVFHCPQNNCVCKGNRHNWDDLPHNKSLFYTGEMKGIAIGNLTSQVFANFYLSSFDKYVKSLDKDIYYGRYVDDFVVIHHDKEFLKSIRERLKIYLRRECKLTLHPRKQYLQEYKHGVAFIGCFLLPGRTYIGKRLKRNAYAKVADVLKDKITNAKIKDIVACFNSYMGFMCHHTTFKIRMRIRNLLMFSSARMKNSVKCPKPYIKFEPLGQCKPQRKTRKGVLNFKRQNAESDLKKQMFSAFKPSQ